MDKLERRDQIYKIASKQFFLHGFHATTMRKLAREIGVEPPLLYHYYKNKNELFYNIALNGLQELNEDVESVLKSTMTPVEQMSAALTSHIRFTLRRREEMTLTSEIRHLEPEQRAEMRIRFQAYASKFGFILGHGIKKGMFSPCNKTLTVLFILGNATHIAIWYRPDGSIKEDEVIDFYVKSMLRVICCDTADLTKRLNR